MSQFFQTLPQSLRTKLNRWYYISACLLILMLCSMTALYLVTLHRVRTLQSCIQTVFTEKNARAQSTSSALKVQERITIYKKNHQHLYDLLQKFFQALPESISLTHLVVEPFQLIRCSGKSDQAATLNTLLQLLSSLGYSTIVQFTNDQGSAKTVTFQLHVAYNKV